MDRIATLVVLALLLAAPATRAEDPPAQGQRAVLVTGASTGIGRKVTERLAANGFFVYAGARKDTDLAELDAIDNVQAIRLDVFDQLSVHAPCVSAPPSLCD